jgi:hypothetical protein
MADERGLARAAHGADGEDAHRGIAHPAIEPGDLIVAAREFRLSGILRCKLKYNNNNVLPGVSWLGSEVDHGGQV